MDPSSLPQLAAFLALGHGTAFALDLEEWSVAVLAGGCSVSFDTRFAGEGCSFCKWGERERGGERLAAYHANFLSLMSTCERESAGVRGRERQEDGP
jgi:hypothetical protein